MILTREKIKEAQDKNELWDEIFQTMCKWAETAPVSPESSSELAELEQKYQAGIGIVEERVREKIASLEEQGKGRIEELKREEQAIENRRKRTLTPLLEDSAIKIDEKLEEICFDEVSIRDNPGMAPERKREVQDRIRKLSSEVDEIKRKCEKEADKFDIELKKCQSEQNKIHKEYISSEVADEVRKNTFESYRKRYEKKKAELISHNKGMSKEFIKKLEAQLLPENVEVFCQALESCDINGDIVWKGNNRRFVTIGQRKLKKPQMSPETVQGFVRSYSCINEEEDISVPYTINHNSMSNVPILIYQGQRSMDFKKKFLTLCTAYCLSRCGEPLQILHTDALKKGDILPASYQAALSEVFCEIPKGKEVLCLEKLMDYAFKIEQDMIQFKSENIMEYNDSHADRPFIHCLWVMDDLPDSFGEKEVGSLVKLLREGGKWGIKILASMEYGKLMKSSSESFLELRKVLEECGYGYDPDERIFVAVGSDGERLDIRSLEAWEEGKTSLLIHQKPGKGVPCFALVQESASPKSQSPKQTDPKPKVPKPDESQFLQRFLDNGELPKNVYFPAKIRGKNLELPENIGHCLKIFSLDRCLYEDTVFYLLMQLILRNISEREAGNEKYIIYFFNFGENVIRDRRFGLSCSLGLSCCNEIQYVTPETLLPGLKLCLDDLLKHMTDHRVWLVFLGMEYMDFYWGYEEEEERKIAAYYDTLSRYLSTGSCHIVLAGTSIEACRKLKGTENVAVHTIDLDQKKIEKGQEIGSLKLWKPLDGEKLRAFEKRIYEF